MKSIKAIHTITGIATALLFLFITFPSQAAEANSQEQMGRKIKDDAWLRWNKGRVQAETGRFIQNGARSGNISQEALGSGIAASSHLDLELMKKQEQLGTTILNIAQMGNKKTSRTGMGRMQERLGTFIASNAVINQEKMGAEQAVMAQEIQRQARVSWTMGMMAKAAYANLDGSSTQEISGAMISSLRKSKAFEHEKNFRLAMTLLENETGRPMTQIFENSSTGGSAFTRQFKQGGAGGFAEYGLFSLAAFLYVGWVFSHFVTHLGYPRETEGTHFEFPEAA